MSVGGEWAPRQLLSETNLMVAGSGAAYGIPPGAQHPELELLSAYGAADWPTFGSRPSFS